LRSELQSGCSWLPLHVNKYICFTGLCIVKMNTFKVVVSVPHHKSKICEIISNSDSYCYSSDALSCMYLTAFHFCGTGVCSVNRTTLCLCMGCYESVDCSTGMEYWNGLNCY